MLDRDLAAPISLQLNQLSSLKLKLDATARRIWNLSRRVEPHHAAGEKRRPVSWITARPLPSWILAVGMWRPLYQAPNCVHLHTSDRIYSVRAQSSALTVKRRPAGCQCRTITRLQPPFAVCSSRIVVNSLCPSTGCDPDSDARTLPHLHPVYGAALPLLYSTLGRSRGSRVGLSVRNFTTPHQVDDQPQHVQAQAPVTSAHRAEKPCGTIAGGGVRSTRTRSFRIAAVSRILHSSIHRSRC